MPATDSVAGGYSGSAEAWHHGPARIYDRLAQEMLHGVAVDASMNALDLGCGTGAASAALEAAGAHCVAADFAVGMLRVNQLLRPACVACDALALPFPDGTFDLVVAAFCLNHLDRPDDGLREAARVTRPGGRLLASAYADDDSHPVKDAVYRSVADLGWHRPDWQRQLRTSAMPRLATPARATAETHAAGLSATVEKRVVRFGDLTPVDLVEWRLGMAEIAPFVSALPADRRQRLVSDALGELGSGAPPLTRSIILISVTV